MSQVWTMRRFLEEGPLYKFTPVEALKLPSAITKWCDNSACQKETTWTPDFKTEANLWSRTQTLNEEQLITFRYSCADCEDQQIAFWVACYEGQAIVRKIGQSEMPLPKVTKALTKLLGKDHTLYKHGLASMSVGFGLGANAYFRRVVENKTKDILNRIRAISDADGDAGKVAIIDEALQAFSATDRLRLAVEGVPQSLRRGGANPLRILYTAYSAEVHDSNSEEEALSIAQQLQDALDLLIRKLIEHEEDLKAVASLQSKAQRG